MGDLALLRLLQLADSGFPSGAYTLSNGLETLIGEGVVADADDLASFVRTHLLGKFARSDLVSLLAAHRVAAPKRGAGDPGSRLDAIVAIDQRLSATKLAADDRLGSARVGRRLAIEVVRLRPSVILSGFLAAISEGRTAGNAAVAFGLAGSAFGVDSRETALGAASAAVIGLAAVAVRLGLIGHGAAQRLISDAASVVQMAVGIAEAGDWRDLRPSAPQIDAALARHETAPARQFAS